MQIRQDLNKIKKSSHAFVDIGKTEARAKIHQKLLTSMVAGARQSFRFPDK